MTVQRPSTAISCCAVTAAGCLPVQLGSGICCALHIACAASLGVCRPAGTTGEDVRRSVRVGKLNLVDLAGSERVHITGATGRQPAMASCAISQCLVTQQYALQRRVCGVVQR
jgi:hypothetical protein